MLIKRLFVFLTIFAGIGCSLSKQDAPSLTGPSELALSIGMSASPDLITQDGKSQSLLTVTARDANGQPRSGVTLRLAMYVGSTNVDYGTLSSKSISTDNTGQASALYTAPPAPPATVSSDTTVDIQATPVGNNYANSTSRMVTIRLARGGVILPPAPPNTAPVPSFFFSPTTPKEHDSVQFDGSASHDDGQIVSYAWTFGDGSTGTGMRPTHAYNVAGTYQVTLTVIDDTGLSASTPPTSVTVIGGQGPTASFTASPTTPSVGQSVTFNASASAAASGHSIVNYSWDFGDGHSGSGQITTHTYTVASTYTVVLTVTDDLGRTGVSSQTLAVGGSNPTAQFTFSPTNPTVGQSVTFNATASTAPAGHTIVAYDWDFGDGHTGSGVTTTHVYSAASTYTVVLTVRDDLGRLGVTSQTLQVAAATPVPPVPNPTAAFSFSPTNPTVGQSVAFNASASTAATGHSISSYKWDFGDGSSGTGVTATHAYTAPSSYAVVLTVTDDLGHTGVTSQSVQVTGGNPIASFTFSPTNPLVNQVVQFNASASNSPGHSIVSYAWDFGDGFPQQPNVTVSHAFAAASTYTVVLKVTDDLGRVGVTSQTVTVGGDLNPTASFTISKTDPAVNELVQFNGSASTAPAGRTIVSYDWDYGDGSPHGSLVIPQAHAYTSAGTYTVVLSVIDSQGKVGVTSKTVTVGSGGTPPTASFTFSPSAPTAGVLIQFDGTSSTASGGRTIVSYDWDFGDGSAHAIGAQATASHTYPIQQPPAAKDYTVVLKVTDSAGAVNSKSQVVTVNK